MPELLNLEKKENMKKKKKHSFNVQQLSTSHLGNLFCTLGFRRRFSQQRKAHRLFFFCSAEYRKEVFGVKSLERSSSKTSSQCLPNLVRAIRRATGSSHPVGQATNAVGPQSTSDSLSERLSWDVAVLVSVRSTHVDWELLGVNVILDLLLVDHLDSRCGLGHHPALDDLPGGIEQPGHVVDEDVAKAQRVPLEEYVEDKLGEVYIHVAKAGSTAVEHHGDLLGAIFIVQLFQEEQEHPLHLKYVGLALGVVLAPEHQHVASKLVLAVWVDCVLLKIFLRYGLLLDICKSASL